MAERLQEVLAEVVPAIQTLIAKCRAADDAQLKATYAEIKQLLLSNRLATLTKIDNAAILVCPWNRFGTGLDVSDVHSILDDVCGVGVDWELMGVPMCFQLHPRARMARRSFTRSHRKTRRKHRDLHERR